MNSAPVQLLPIENGSGYNNRISEKKPQEVKNESFDNVLDAEMRKDSVEDRKKVENPLNTEKSEKNLKSEKEKKEKASTADKAGKQKSADDAPDDTAAAASVSRKNRVETAVKNLKKGLTVSVEKTAEKASGEKKPDSGELTAEVKKTAGKAGDLFLKGKIESGIKTGEKGSAAVKASAAPELQDLKIKNDDSKKVSHKTTESRADRLAELLSSTAESLKEKSRKPGAEQKPSVKPAGIVNQVKAGKAERAESAKDDKTGKTKLRVVDHRRNASVTETRLFKAAAEGDSLTGKAESADSPVLSLSDTDNVLDFSKSDSRSQNIKNLQSSVLNQLKESLNSQIVKQAGIVVKNNGTGEIRLVMKPESLGKVRIQLSLNDNHIAGRIIVENNIVREIFESNLENLYKAFGSEGFEAGGLEVSVEGQGGNSGARQQKGRNGSASRAVQSIEESIPVVNTEWQDNAVNMVV